MKGLLVDRIQAGVRQGLPPRPLLAVSGGIDSMVLLHAATAVRPAADLVAATFDHASGPHSAAAADLVERAAMSAGVPIVIGVGERLDRPSEAAWRDARLAFLRAAAYEHQAMICTAHTRDDQVETVLFRELRGAGPRGLAGLAAGNAIVRPLLTFTRNEVTDYARAAGVEWVDDPTNDDPAFTRNRLRHELLPAMRATHPGIDSDLAAIGDRAARWREDVDAFVDQRVRFDIDPEGDFLEVSRDALTAFSDDALAIVWPALLARVGVAADWRGTRRVVAFTNRGRTGQRIQLSGGWTVFCRRRVFEVRRERPPGR
jgi:tRNA(Ile)-lysidine synthase